MLKHHIIIILFCVIYPLTHINGQKRSWTLEECISHALANNIELKQQSLSINEAEISKQQTRLNYIPSVSVESGHNLTQGNPKGNTATNFNLSASGETQLFAGFKKHYARHSADLSLRSTILEVSKAKNDLTLAVTAAYLEVLLADENIGITTNKIEILKRQEARTQNLMDAGKATLSDLLSIRAQIADAHIERLSAVNRRDIAGLEICQMLEIDDPETFAVIEPENMKITETEKPYI